MKSQSIIKQILIGGCSVATDEVVRERCGPSTYLTFRRNLAFQAGGNRKGIGTNAPYGVIARPAVCRRELVMRSTLECRTNDMRGPERAYELIARLRFGALPAPTFEIATGTKSAEETDMTILEALHLLGQEVIR